MTDPVLDPIVHARDARDIVDGDSRVDGCCVLATIRAGEVRRGQRPRLQQEELRWAVKRLFQAARVGRVKQTEQREGVELEF